MLALAPLISVWTILLIHQTCSYILPNLPQSDIIKVIDHNSSHTELEAKHNVSAREVLVQSVLSQKFVFAGDWDPNKRSIIDFAINGAEQIAASALATLINDGTTYSSFQRYFQDDHLGIVKRIFTRTLAYMEAPGTQNSISECDNDIQTASQMNLYDGDGPGCANCEAGGAEAYSATEALLEGREWPQPFIALCDDFWIGKMHLYIHPDSGYTYVSNLGPNIDDGRRGKTGIAESLASTILHEFLHFAEMSTKVLAHLPRAQENNGHHQIIDGLVYNPRTGHWVEAYRAYYSMKINDPAFRTREPAIFNADSYVSFALECYYARANMHWEDPAIAQWEYTADDPTEQSSISPGTIE